MKENELQEFKFLLRQAIRLCIFLFVLFCIGLIYSII